LNVDTDDILKKLDPIQISLPCWQGDDVTGFEDSDSNLDAAGLKATGNFPGKARTVDELRMDLEKAFSQIPGDHRLNLHAIYGDFSREKADRNAIGIGHFTDWVEWAAENGLKLDFNATCFAHPQADSGFTLSHRSSSIRKFWIEHVKRCRLIGSYFGRKLNSPCVHNLWIPDGFKDFPGDRWTPRALLKESLDEIYSETYPWQELRDALESKLFGIGSEAYVVGSHEFYLGYAQEKGLMVCLDMGHFHPTESVADKISSILLFSNGILLHISRGVRWDSDHVPILDDDLRALASEVVRAGALERIHLALDFFDASLNRVGALVIGARAVLKSLLAAFLEPHSRLVKMEQNGDFMSRLALQEAIKTMPAGSVWDYHCLKKNVLLDTDWMDVVKEYEDQVLSKRGR
jgi:L-rhamnose isomerase